MDNAPGWIPFTKMYFPTLIKIYQASLRRGKLWRTSKGIVHTVNGITQICTHEKEKKILQSSNQEASGRKQWCVTNDALPPQYWTWSGYWTCASVPSSTSSAIFLFLSLPLTTSSGCVCASSNLGREGTDGVQTRPRNNYYFLSRHNPKYSK